MSREIKFRYVFKDIDTEEIFFKFWNINEIESDTADFINDYFGDIELLSRDQYTGLKDKNEREIYEGDIIKYNYYGNFIIEFEEYGISPFCIVDYDGCMEYPPHNECEVIGNIHENSNLLETI